MGKIGTSGIVDGQIVYAENVLRIINALTAITGSDILINGGLFTTGSFQVFGSASFYGGPLYISGGANNSLTRFLAIDDVTNQVSYVTASSITGGGGVPSASNGLSVSASNVILGGTLNKDTIIEGSGSSNFYLGNVTPINTTNFSTNTFQVVSPSVSVDVTGGGFQITGKDARYFANYSGSYTSRSLVDQEYVLGLTSSIGSKWTGSTDISRLGNVSVTGSLNVLNGQVLFGSSSSDIITPGYKLDVRSTTTGSIIIKDSTNVKTLLSIPDTTAQVTWQTNGIKILSNASSVGGITLNGTAAVGNTFITSPNFQMLFGPNLNWTGDNVSITAGTGNAINSSSLSSLLTLRGNFSGTSSANFSIINITSSVINSTSTGQVSIISVTPTYTTTGGNVYGINYDPILTSISGSHLAFRAASGRVLIGTGSIASASLHVSGNAVISNTLGVGLQTTSSNTLQIRGVGTTTNTTLLVENAAQTPILTIIDAGSSSFNGNTNITGSLLVRLDTNPTNSTFPVLEIYGTKYFSQSVPTSPSIIISSSLWDNNVSNNTAIQWIKITPILSHSGHIANGDSFVNLSPSTNATGSATIDISNIFPVLKIAPTYTNQRNIMGSAIYINPTFAITAANNWSAIVIEQGNNIFHRISGSTAFGNFAQNSLTGSNMVQIRARPSTTTALYVENDSGSRIFDIKINKSSSFNGDLDITGSLRISGSSIFGGSVLMASASTLITRNLFNPEIIGTSTASQQDLYAVSISPIFSSSLAASRASGLLINVTSSGVFNTVTSITAITSNSLNNNGLKVINGGSGTSFISLIAAANAGIGTSDQFYIERSNGVNGQVNFSNTGTGNIVLSPSAIPLVYVKNPYVGIGFSAPIAPLHVSGNVLFPHTLTIGQSPTSSGDTLHIHGVGTTTNTTLLVENAVPTPILTIIDAGTSSFNGNHNITGSLYVSGGLVGIGTSSPSGALHVYNSANSGSIFSANSTISGSGGIINIHQNGSASAANGILFKPTNDLNSLGIYANSTTSLRIAFNTFYTEFNAGRISVGNVPVNTTYTLLAPTGVSSYAIGVSGSVSASVGSPIPASIRDVSEYHTGAETSSFAIKSSISLEKFFRIRSGSLVNVATLNLTPTYDQQISTGSFTGILYQPILTSLSGSHYFISASSGRILTSTSSVDLVNNNNATRILAQSSSGEWVYMTTSSLHSGSFSGSFRGDGSGLTSSLDSHYWKSAGTTTLTGDVIIDHSASGYKVDHQFHHDETGTRGFFVDVVDDIDGNRHAQFQVGNGVNNSRIYMEATYDNSNYNYFILRDYNSQLSAYNLSLGGYFGFIWNAYLGTFLFSDSRTTATGLEYGADYSSTYTSRSLVDKGYLSKINNDVIISGSLTVSESLYVRSGSNSSIGRATLSGGQVIVSSSKVTPSSSIFLTVQGGTLTNVGTPYILTRTGSVSFTIKSTNILDTSDVAWFIVEPV